MFPKARGEDILFRAPSVQYPPRHKNPAFMAVAFLVLVASGYILLHSSSIFATPELVVEEPEDGAHVAMGEIEVYGSTEPKTRVSINGYEVLSDDDGLFMASLSFQRGYQILDIRVKNRVGKEAKVVRRIVVE